MENNLEWFRVPEKIYFKRGCLPIALRELKEVYDRKKAVILIDDDGFRNGLAKPVTDQLNELNIFYSLIAVKDTEEIIATVKKFEPDCLIAVGTEAISIGKLIRIRYENPELTLTELYSRINLRDRTRRVLKTGKIYFIAVAGSTCFGGEVSPFSMPMPPEDEIKIQDYALLPDMSIIDTDMIQNKEKYSIAFMSMMAVHKAAEVFASEYKSDYAEGLAVRAIQLIFAYFPKYQENPADLYVLERLSNAVEMAHMAYSNVYDETNDIGALPDWNPAASALGMTPEELEKRFSEIRKVFLS